MSEETGCPFCEGAGARVVVQGGRWRVIHAQEAGFPAFYRVVWQDHVRELSQLPRADRIACLDVVTTIEGLMLRHLAPAKVNLATLGNMAPHLHWHVVARFVWDSHFPAPVWAPAQREADAARLRELEQRLPAFEDDLLAALSRAG